MSVLDTPVLTPAQKGAAALKEIAAQAYRLLLSQIKNADQIMWANRQATPDEINAALGTNAAEVFALRLAAATLLNGAKANSIAVDPPRAVTANQDGSVTIAPQSSSSSSGN